MTHRYTAAGDGWFAFITPARQLFVGTELDAGAVERLWARVRDERGPAGILESLTAEGLLATPPFVFLEAGDGSVSAIVRGDAVVTAGAEQTSGSGVTTWIERRFAADAVDVTLGGTAGPELPLEAGVVRASAFAGGVVPAGDRIAAEPSVEPASEPQPAPESQSEPQPQPAPQPAPELEPEPELATRVSEETVASLDDGAVPAAALPSGGAAPEQGDGYDYLFGDTMYRSVQDAAVIPEEVPDEAERVADVATPEGDHDGSTVLASSIPRGRTGRRPKASTPAAPATPSIAVVLPNGAREMLDPVIVIGRAPSVAGVPAGQLPRLVTISGGDMDISRSHVRIAAEGGMAVVTDLHSRNGTTILLPNGERQKLRAGDPTPAVPGTVVDLGGGIELSVEEI